MQTPEKSEQEKERLEALLKLNILDTPKEERFERITRISSRLFNTEISAISLLDEERQWFKSMKGLDIHEAPRDISFCTYAISQDKIFIVEDAKVDPQFCNNPMVVGPPYIRFYAGCQIIIDDKYKVGTLCLADSKPRKFSAEDETSLSDLAAIVEAEFLRNYVGALESERSEYMVQLSETEAENFHIRNVLQKAFDNYPGEVVIINSEDKVQFSNQSATNEQLKNDHYSNAYPLLNQKDIIKHINNRSHFETTLQTGESFIKVSIYPGKNQDTFKAMILIEDVTEKTVLQKGLIHAEKIASIGSMAAGISHEIKNPLAAIKLNSQVVQKKISLLPEPLDSTLENLPKLLELIVISSNRIDQIITSMLHHCLNSESSPKISIDYKEIITNVLNFIKLDRQFCHEFKVDEVKVKQDYQTELQTECVSVEIEQVLFNLIKNAYQAFTNQPEKQITITSYEDNSNIVLSIKDNGPGIPKENIDKIFDSLFSTKGEQGNGLGLAICRIIIEGQGGTLTLNPNYQDGAEFIITFPRQ